MVAVNKNIEECENCGKKDETVKEYECNAKYDNRIRKVCVNCKCSYCVEVS